MNQMLDSTNHLFCKSSKWTNLRSTVFTPSHLLLNLKEATSL